MRSKKIVRPIMFVGTGSDVGKSFISTGFCRVFRQDGYHPAPFKAQNMSLNSYATPEGGEIGRAQAVQAEACGLACHTDMNPVLLKPTTDRASQVILHGRPVGQLSAMDYFVTADREALFAEARAAYQRLAAKYSPIVMEGAGSISELNLKHRDITNMRMAIETGAATYLIADIDRGGVFGSLYGTMALLNAEEKRRIKGIIINKFRGDARLFESGRAQLEELCRVPVVGVLPLRRDIFIEEEDSLNAKQRQDGAADNKVKVAVILLPRMSNFTDFDRLERDPRIHLFYTREAAELSAADIIILPGSKNTIEDLLTIKSNGIAGAIRDARKNHKTVIGICGGYQMMGEVVEDPLHIETSIEKVSGLGLLPVHTTMQPEKTVRQCKFRFLGHEESCIGYEIHMGETKTVASGDEERPLNRFCDGHTDGYFLDERCWGTYLHGILDNPIVINQLIATYSDRPVTAFDYRQYKDEQYDKLAAMIREHVDMEQVYKSMQM